MVNPLSDGTPLTYDWLNLLAKEINDQQQTVKTFKNKDKVNFRMNHKYSSSDYSGTIQFLTGSATITVKDGKGQSAVSFKPEFAKGNVMVLSQINLTTDSDFVGIVTPNLIKKDGCVLKVQQYGKSSKKDVSVTVSFVAIGPGTS